MPVKIQIRRDLETNWSTNNPTLSLGELGFVTDTLQLKIGNGSTEWNELPYFLNSASATTVEIAEAVSDIIGLSPESLDTLEEVAAAFNNDPDFFNTIGASVTSASAFALSEANDYTDNEISSLTTTDIDEGSNLYFTNQRALDATVSTIASASAAAVLSSNDYTDSEISSASSSLISYTNTASANLIDYTDDEITNLNIFSNISTSPSTQLIEADNNSDTLTFISGDNIEINANSSNDSIDVSLSSELIGIDSISTPKFIEFDTEFTPDNGMPKGSLYWNNEDQTLDVSLDNEVVLSLGQDEHYPPVFNNSGVQINRGELVMVTGVQGDKLTIAKAVTDGTVDFEYIIGVAAHDIPNTSDTATIIKFGYVKPFNTNSYSVGTILYPDKTVPGGFTNLLPDAPAYKIPIAIVTKQGTGGTILVRMVAPSRLGESDSNVQFKDLNTGDLLVYNADEELWVNSKEITGDLSILGNLVVSGSTEFVNKFDSVFEDPILYLGTNASGIYTSDILDVGFTAPYGPGESGSTHYHRGFIWDNTTDKWRLFSNIPHFDDNLPDFSDAIYDTLVLGEVEGNLDGVAASANYVLYTNVDGLAQNYLTQASASTTYATKTEVNNLTTTDIDEGSNLYFTNQRALDATVSTIASASAAAVSSANGYTDGEVASAIVTASAAAVSYADGLTTTDIDEGSNLYFTEERALTTASTALVHEDHTNISAVFEDNKIKLTASGGGGGSDNLEIDSKTDSYVLVLSDNNKVIEMNSSSENNVTVPANSSVQFPIGASIDIVQIGTGKTSIVASSEVTIKSKGSALNLTEQYSAVTLYKRDINDWVLIGDLS